MAAATLFYVVALAGAVAVVVRVARLRRSPNRPAARAYIALLAALTLTFAVMATPTQAWINQRVLDGGKLLGNVSTLVAAYAVVALHSYTRWPAEQAWPRLRWRLALLLAACGTLVVTFALPHPVPLTGSFDGLYALDPSLAVYTTAYALFLGLALADHVRLSLAFARAAPRFLRAGLRLLAVAGVGGLLYAASKLAIVVHRLATGATHQPGNDAGVCHGAFSSLGCTVAVGGPGLVGLLAVAGVLAWAASARLENLAHWTSILRTYRRLEPLWQAVTAAVPEARGDRATAAELAEPRELTWRLARRYVEIRDGLLLLSRYRTHHPQPGKSTAAAEARAIQAAIEAKQTGRPGRDGAASLAVPSGQLAVDTDTAWLEQVAAAYTRLPRRPPETPEGTAP
ncbi:MAB_1171c family putative transporter [Prauserella muralis]|uniref:DUF6545 domain-containing protein n=1 Tax=Prauserella muralis TaxID=588067 RepID=A0A2V4AES5_9PSEU|nr:MAB_1171c family putative transporter [Prauserella muralis]PXY16507.1 hypothetical protein BAY60_35465 [Prauserella muralis]TWE11119.1 hypothetical protein FHX69_7338 [Prauserella muralis]